LKEGGYMGTTKLMGIIRIIIMLSIISFFASCGGGGGGGDTTGTADNSGGDDNTDTGGNVKYQGFNFSLEQGDFFEYGWDYYYSSASSGGSSEHLEQAGAFRISLGAPVTIDGVNFYLTSIKGINGAKDEDDKDYSFAPRWKYIAIDKNKMLGSTDGVQASVIFDAEKGYWAGGGFLKAFASDKLIKATGPTSLVANDYIASSVALKVGESFNQSECEDYPGIGTICGDESHDYTESEYYIPNVGPALYYYYNSASYGGGGYYDSFTWIKHVGLIASSLRGDSIDYILENEPNNIPSEANPANNMKICGYVMKSKDLSTSVTLTLNNQTNNIPIHDWFVISPPPNPDPQHAFTLNISLDFTGCASATDLDLYLFSSSTQLNNTTLKAYSINDNEQTGSQKETIQVPLGRGTYYIGVSGWNIDSANKHETARYYLTNTWQ
jgi:hypothetical protein